MKKLAPVIALAAGMLALGACSKTPADNAAANVRDAADNMGDAIDNQAAAIRDTADNRADALENRGDAVRDAGENHADSIEANGSNSAK